jgi:hypothetical protein
VGILLVLVLLLGGIGYLIGYTATRMRRPRGARPVRPTAPRPGRGDAAQPWSALDAALAEWTAAGLLSADQATAIRKHETAKPAPGPLPQRPRRGTSLAEALGYLGGALALAGVVLLVARYWSDVGLAGQLTISGAASVLLLLGGAAIGDATAPSLVRLRAVAWLASAGTTAVFAVVAVRDGFDVSAAETLTLVGAGAVAVDSGLLWRGLHRPLQQLACLAAVIVALGAAVAEVTDPPGWSGVTVLVAGFATVALGLRRLVPSEVPTEALGAVAVVVGGQLAAGEWNGPGGLLLVVSVVALAALALVPGLAPRAANPADYVALGSVAAVGLSEGVPFVVRYFSQDAAGITGLVTYAAGAALIAIAAARLVRVPDVVEALGAVTLLAGAAVTFGQWHGFAPLLGTVSAIALIAVGMLPGRTILTYAGALGLLVNVPWLIAWFFPGEGRVPLLTLGTGAVLVGIAVLLTRRGGGDRRGHHSPAM